MKKLLKYALLAIIVCVFMGCGNNQYAIQYNTNPIGASIVCNGVSKGLSPLTLYYELDPEKLDKKGFVSVAPCKAVFVSGYEDYFQSRFDINRFPDGVQTTLTRPKGKGYKQDMAFGVEHQRTLIMQRQAEAAEAAAWAAQQQMWNQQFQYQDQQMQKWLPKQQQTTICNTFGSITVCD